MDQTPPKPEYKPNLYPIMYWAILYGLIAAFVLLALNFIANFVTLLWFPVFLAGVIWGGFRKYKQDKAAWVQSQPIDPTMPVGMQAQGKSPIEEFKDAARDIAQASKDMMVRQAQEDAIVQAQAEQQEVQAGEEPITPEPPEEQKPPQSPLQPLV